MALLDLMIKQAIEVCIYESCLALNSEDWEKFLSFCAKDKFNYRITNYSPEIKKEQCWMERNWQGLKGILDILPKHNTNHSPLTRHITVYQINPTNTANVYDVVSIFSLYRTELDGLNSHLYSGQTKLFAVGKYIDQIRVDSELFKAEFIDRNVVLETRQIDVGSHIPF